MSKDITDTWAVKISAPTEAAFVFSDKDPIILTALEFMELSKRGRKFCLHRWQYRSARNVGGLKVVYDDHVVDMNIPAGRICSKCGKMDWVARKDAKVPWKHTDFYVVVERLKTE